MNSFNSKNKIFIFLAASAVLGVLVSYFYIGYSSEFGSDASEFRNAAVFLSEGGEVSGEVLMNRVIPSPFFLYTSVGINFFLNNFGLSFSIINIFFYILCVFAFYFLALEIYKEKRIAVISTVLVLFNYYVIDPGNAHLA